MSVRENIAAVLERIAECERKSGRGGGSVKLLAVSKFHPAMSVIEAMDSGHFLFGENRVQEAAAKFDSVRDSGYEPVLHIIGTLQRNKVREAVRISSCIESVDRIELLSEIERQCARIGKRIGFLVEFHTGEESKAGFEDADSVRCLLERCASGDFPHAVPSGFMTMAPNTDDEGEIRKSFSALRSLSERMRSEFPGLPLSELSMGMSADFPIAIEEGATIVRVGTAIFGERA